MADKLASTDNMKYIHRHGGRFVTILPATRKEDRQFRSRLTDPDSITWNHVYDVLDDRGEVQDTFTVCSEEMLSKEKYHLWWFHSIRKARRDESTRMSQSTERPSLSSMLPSGMRHTRTMGCSQSGPLAVT